MPYIAEYLAWLVVDLNIVMEIKIIYYKILSKINKKKAEKFADEVNIEKEKLRIIKEKREDARKNPYKLIFNKNYNTNLLIVIMLICVLTGLLTPLGDTPYTYLVNTMQGNTTENINEHLPLTLINQKDIICVIVAILIILIFTDVKISLKDLFMLGGLFLLTLMSKRQISMFLIIGVLSVNKLICFFMNKYDPKFCEKVETIMTSLVGKIVTLALITAISYYIGKDKLDDNYINSSSYPVEASNYILNNLDINNMRLYNEYNYGSYLLYRGIPVFIDSRADLYAPEFNGRQDIFSDFLNISNIGVYYEDKFEEYGITHVIVYRNAKLNMFLSRNNDYKQLYLDNNFVIYERLLANN